MPVNPKKALLDELNALLASVPVALVAALVKLVRDALSSDDPMRAIQRRATAEASHAAAQESVQQIIKRT